MQSETKSAISLPKMLAGVVVWQWVRCGRAGCRCAKGKLHGPYAYRVFREGNRLRKEYVPKHLAEKVTAACQARREFRRQLNASWRQWRNLLNQVQEAEHE